MNDLSRLVRLEREKTMFLSSSVLRYSGYIASFLALSLWSLATVDRIRFLRGKRNDGANKTFPANEFLHRSWRPYYVFLHLQALYLFSATTVLPRVTRPTPRQHTVARSVLPSIEGCWLPDLRLSHRLVACEAPVNSPLRLSCQ